MKIIKSFYNNLHLNLIKEIVLIIVSNLLSLVLGISLFIIYKSFNYIILMIIVFIFLNAILVYRYILIKNKIDLENLNEVSNAFMYFYLDVNNKVSPIKALNNVKSHCSINMSNDVSLLLDEISKDSTFSPFIKFANRYPSVIVESLLFTVYRLIAEFNEQNILSFNACYKEYKNKVENIRSKNYKKQFAFITLNPVIGTMIITILVIISTILLVRGYING